MTVDCDFILVEGFGRNVYTNKELTTLIRPQRNRLGDDSAMFKWLSENAFDPGTPNRILAEACVRQMRFYGFPAIVQWEVAYAVWNEYPAFFEKYRGSFFVVWPWPKGYQGSHGLHRDAKRICGQITGKNMVVPLLIAHPEHVQRCYFVAKKRFGGAGIFQLIRSKRWFDRKSKQWQTKGNRLWLFYEICLARPYGRLSGWM